MLDLKVKYSEAFSGEKISIPRKGDIGIDVYAAEDVYIPTGTCALIDLGMSVEIPEGYWISFRDRSSMSKYTHVLAGVIDTSYRGPLKVRMFCHTDKENEKDEEDFNRKSTRTSTYILRAGIGIRKGDKIAQMILHKDYNSEFSIQEVEELSETERGDGGFGSTGS